MADKVELVTPAPPAVPPAGTLAEAVVQAPKGNTTSITVDTTQKPGEDKKKEDRPEWLPEEFKSPQEMAEAWKKSKTDPKPNQAEADKKTEEAVQKAGLDMDALASEFAKDGKLSDASMGKLQKNGISKDMVDAYIAGQKARGEAYQSKVAESVGGPENLAATLKWAETALTPDEIVAANKALQSGDVNQASLVLAGLHSRRVAQDGSDPQFVQGRSAPGRGDVAGYESSQQWIDDVNTKQYRKDPAFRERVQKRIAASKF